MSPWFHSPQAQRDETLSRANERLAARPPARLELVSVEQFPRSTGPGQTHVNRLTYASGRVVETYFTRDAVLIEQEVAR